MKLSDLNFGKVEKDSNFNQLGLTAEDYDYALLMQRTQEKNFLNYTISCIVKIFISKKVKI